MTNNVYFPKIGVVPFDPKAGPEHEIVYRHWNPDELVEGIRMEDLIRPSMAYWHTFRGNGSDPFGSGTMLRPWDDGSESIQNALRRADAAFEFMQKSGIRRYCFHDRDVAPEGGSFKETCRNLDEVTKKLEELQAATGCKLLWGTANMFSHPRFMHGAATTCNASVFAYAGAQVAKAMEVTKRLGGENYVFWGGREGYMTLLNTNMKRELANLGRFMHMAKDHASAIGFTGQFLFEPKPKEPTKHQYDYDAAACLNFIGREGLDGVVKLNIETNHATLAGHDVMHELEYARIHGALGSIDANTGDLLLGWDTDQFPTDIYLATKMMLVVLEQGGLGKGGFNFDAKVRRESFEPLDLFHAHVGALDILARGAKIAAKIRASGILKDFVRTRYASFDSGIGKEIESGHATFASLTKYIEEAGDSTSNQSGRQEYLENCQSPK